MARKIDKTILEKLPIETLRLLKLGEKLLEQKHLTENTINTKVIGMLQVLFPVFVGAISVYRRPIG